MAVRLVHSAKLAETCPPFAKVSARRQMALADWAEDTRCAPSAASQRGILRRRVKARMVANEKRVSDDVVCTPSAQGMLTCAGENHISIVPDRFLHLHGQAEIHMYICYMWKQVEKNFLLSFEYLGILAANFLVVYVFGYQCRWAVVVSYSQGRASV